MNQDHIFIDTETSGLHPEKDCIIQLAAIRTDSRGKVMASFCENIRPDRAVNPEAAKVNGYDPETWGGISFKAAIAKFNRAMVRDEDDKVVFVAHFADFDRSFLRSDCERHGCEVPLATRAWICTGALVWPYLYQDQLRSRKLTDVCDFFEIPYTRAHDAASDVKACMDVYFEAMRRYSTMLVTHTALAQSKGGPLLKGLERFVSKL
jgi:DNA polymerase III epsilon subunit-like protein